MNLRKTKRFLWSAVLLITAACATVVPPSGGPPDTTPPVPLSYKPQNKSVNFNGGKIVIKFDEFIELKDLNSQLVVSPAMSDEPDIYVQGKKLIIETPDSLEKNTTYTIYLGNSVVNYKEGLPVPHFQYVFSTGNNLDSLQITGTLRNAFDLKTEGGVLLMLYKNPSDSAPYIKRPSYIAKTYDNGNFALDNLSAGEYMIFGLKDLNSNYLYDQPSEEIAFLDSLIIPAPVKRENDSLNHFLPVVVDMFLFKEIEKKQGINDKKLRSPKLIEIYFKRPVKELSVTPLNTSLQPNWYYPVFSKNNDSLKLWITAETPDTLLLEISDNRMVVDTLQFILRKPQKKVKTMRGRKKNTEVQQPVTPAKTTERITVKTNTSGRFDFFRKPAFIFSTPVKSLNPDKIKLYKQVDTIFEPLNFKLFFRDTVAADVIFIDIQLDEESIYKIFVPDSVFYDIFGNTNDTIETTFGTTRQRNYGSLLLHVNYKDTVPLIIQLLNGKDAVIEQDILKDSVIYYPYLKPGKYKVKAIKDRNRNGKWDTGNYLKGILPERVFYMNSSLNIRANWDIEHRWILNK